MSQTNRSNIVERLSVDTARSDKSLPRVFSYRCASRPNKPLPKNTIAAIQRNQHKGAIFAIHQERTTIQQIMAPQDTATRRRRFSFEEGAPDIISLGDTRTRVHPVVPVAIQDVPNGLEVNPEVLWIYCDQLLHCRFAPDDIIEQQVREIFDSIRDFITDFTDEYLLALRYLHSRDQSGDFATVCRVVRRFLPYSDPRTFSIAALVPYSRNDELARDLLWTLEWEVTAKAIRNLEIVSNAVFKVVLGMGRLTKGVVAQVSTVYEDLGALRGPLRRNHLPPVLRLHELTGVLTERWSFDMWPSRKTTGRQSAVRDDSDMRQISRGQ